MKALHELKNGRQAPETADEEIIKNLRNVQIRFLKTSITQKQSSVPDKYRFELYLNRKTLLYRSKFSILDQPNWKNELLNINLDSCSDWYSIKIYRQNTVIDKIDIANPLKDIDLKVFLNQSTCRGQVDSKNHRYVLEYDWQCVGKYHRLAKSLEKDKCKTQKSIDELKKYISEHEAKLENLEQTRLEEFDLSIMRADEEVLRMQPESQLDSYQMFNQIKDERQAKPAQSNQNSFIIRDDSIDIQRDNDVQYQVQDAYYKTRINDTTHFEKEQTPVKPTIPKIPSQRRTTTDFNDYKSPGGSSFGLFRERKFNFPAKSTDPYKSTQTKSVKTNQDASSIKSPMNSGKSANSMNISLNMYRVLGTTSTIGGGNPFLMLQNQLQQCLSSAYESRSIIDGEQEFNQNPFELNKEIVSNNQTPKRRYSEDHYDVDVKRASTSSEFLSEDCHLKEKQGSKEDSCIFESPRRVSRNHNQMMNSLSGSPLNSKIYHTEQAQSKKQKKIDKLNIEIGRNPMIAKMNTRNQAINKTSKAAHNKESKINFDCTDRIPIYYGNKSQFTTSSKKGPKINFNTLIMNKIRISELLPLQNCQPIINES